MTVYHICVIILQNRDFAKEFSSMKERTELEEYYNKSNNKIRYILTEIKSADNKGEKILF